MRRWRKVSPARSRSGGPYGLRGRDANEIERARISMMARNTNVPFKGRIQKRKTQYLQIITFGLQRAAGPYRRARSRHSRPDLRKAAKRRSGRWPVALWTSQIGAE